MKLWRVFDGEESSWVAAADADAAIDAHKDAVSDGDPDVPFDVLEVSLEDAKAVVIGGCEDRPDGRANVPLSELFEEHDVGTEAVVLGATLTS